MVNRAGGGVYIYVPELTTEDLMPKPIAIIFWSMVAACVFSFGMAAFFVAHFAT